MLFVLELASATWDAVARGRSAQHAQQAGQPWDGTFQMQEEPVFGGRVRVLASKPLAGIGKGTVGTLY